jgi:dihydrofolate reductase / thymidylate synthase
MTKVNLIVALSRKNYGIGVNNNIPWKLSEDMAYFKKTTIGNQNKGKNIVLMGRKTWESIPSKFKPLKDRINVVLTNQPQYRDKANPIVINNLEQFLEKPLDFVDETFNEIFVIGGETLYKRIIDDYVHLVNKIYVTEIYKEFVCDTFAPKFHKMVGDTIEYSNVSNFNYCKESDTHFRFVEYTGKKFLTKLKWINIEEQNYLNTLWKLLHNGELRKNRTGIDTKSLFSCVGNYNLEDTFPALTTRRIFFRGIFEELMFYLSGKTDNQILVDKNVNIWTGNTTREFLDSRGLNHYKTGDMGETYGFNYRHFGAVYKGCDTNYTGLGYDQVQNALNLIKNNPESRRIVISLWNPATLDNASLPPCMFQYQFFVNIQEKKLNCLVNLRSSDYFLANNWNTCTAAIFVHLICNLEGINLTPGKLTVMSCDTHIYTNHEEQIKDNLKRQYKPAPKLLVHCDKKKDIMDFEFSDLKLIGYYPDSSIQASMAV